MRQLRDLSGTHITAISPSTWRDKMSTISEIKAHYLSNKYLEEHIPHGWIRAADMLRILFRINDVEIMVGGLDEIISVYEETIRRIASGTLGDDELKSLLHHAQTLRVMHVMREDIRAQFPRHA